MIYKITISDVRGEKYYKWVLEENIDSITGTAYYDSEKYGDEHPILENMTQINMKNDDVIKNIIDIQQVPIVDN